MRFTTLHCPFCGHKACPTRADEEINDGATLSPYRHTLFIATDEGFEFRSPRFDENVGIVGLSDDEWPDEGYDQWTDKVSLTDAVKFARYVGPLSGMRDYIRFAPIENG